jgi:peptidoglycan/LPS O-acetylase OafA/YrhL
VKYVPGLDGLRAIAVIAVLLFHADVAYAPGGFLGVSLFFTLSGFLITTLLLHEHAAAGSIDLRRFYSRRVRRLLPAAYACLLGVAAVSGMWSAEQQRNLAGDLIASVLNVANWRVAFSARDYSDIFLGAPSPAAHFWSLAIEEQIYLVLPLVAIVALAGGRRRFACVTGGLLAASVTATLLTTDRDLAYNATYTRAAELLVGVALAQLMFGRRERFARPSTDRRRARAVAGSGALVGFGLLVVSASLDQAWIYRGGLVGVAMLSAVLIVAVVEGGFVSRLVSVPPLVAIGRVSYGIYLFHWPVFLLLDTARTGLTGPALVALRCLVTGVLTVMSYRLLEQPIRQGTLITRDRALVPMTIVGAAAVAVAGVVLVPAPALTQTQELLVLGEAELVDFTSVAVSDERSFADAIETVNVNLDIPVDAAARIRIAVLGSDPVTAAELAALGPDRYDVVDASRPDCPLATVGSLGCPPLPERWRAVAGHDRPDALLIVTGAAEADEMEAQSEAAVTRDELVATAQVQDAAFSDLLETIDAALAAGVAVIWYTVADRSDAYSLVFDRITLERPVVTTVVGDVAVLSDGIDQAVVAAQGSRDGQGDLRLLVIGDSTSLSFARALNDAADGQVEVLWAGKNGCPLAAVEAVRSQRNAPWTEPRCPVWSEKVAPLVGSFRPDVLFVMTGAAELQEYRFAGDPTGYVAVDAAFVAARDAQITALLDVLGPDVPVLVADVPAIAGGRFSNSEMMKAARLDALNGSNADLAARHAQVSLFPYRDVLEAAEAARPPGDPIRSDGVHPDAEPLAALARSHYLPTLRALAVRVPSDRPT